MKEILYALPGIALTICCWGSYGSVLHKGQANLGNDKLKPLICVGVAYLLVAIILPVVILAVTGRLQGDWSSLGIQWSLAAGAAGAIGALGIILALTSGGSPIYVMPLVFGGAPIVNVLVTMYFSGISWKELNLNFIAGTIIVVIGATLVLYNKPSAGPKGHGGTPSKPVPAETKQA